MMDGTPGGKRGSPQAFPAQGRGTVSLLTCLPGKPETVSPPAKKRRDGPER